MQDFSDAFDLAFTLVLSGDANLLEIIGLSLRVSLVTVASACLIGLPVGAVLAIFRFPGRHAVIVLLNALMGLPPQTAMTALLWDARYSLLTVALADFGR